MAGTAELAEPCAAAAAAVRFEQEVEGLPAPPLPGDALGQAEVPPAVLDAVETESGADETEDANEGVHGGRQD